MVWIGAMTPSYVLAGKGPCFLCFLGFCVLPACASVLEVGLATLRSSLGCSFLCLSAKAPEESKVLLVRLVCGDFGFVAWSPVFTIRRHVCELLLSNPAYHLVLRTPCSSCWRSVGAANWLDLPGQAICEREGARDLHGAVSFGFFPMRPWGRNATITRPRTLHGRGPLRSSSSVRGRNQPRPVSSA